MKAILIVYILAGNATVLSTDHFPTMEECNQAKAAITSTPILWDYLHVACLPYGPNVYLP